MQKLRIRRNGRLCHRVGKAVQGSQWGFILGSGDKPSQFFRFKLARALVHRRSHGAFSHAQ